jgi:8-oxo-dGTP diphosphatase
MPKKQIAVVGAVFRRDGRLLLAQRSSGHLAGMWEFPGGKIEDGETPQESLARELKEELGVKAEIGEFVADTVFEYEQVYIHLSCFWIDYYVGELEPREHSQIQWVLPEQLATMNLAPADIPIALSILEGEDKDGICTGFGEG